MIRRLSLAGLLIVLSVFSGCGSGILTPSHHITEEYNEAFAAASSGDLVTLQTYVANDHAILGATEWDGRTLLHDAVDKGRQNVAKYLLDQGANIDGVTQDGRTAIHMAAQHGDIPMITLLLRYKAKINPVDGKGWTPLDRAEKWGHADAVSFLRGRGGQEGASLR